ncbi:fimbrial biogenesis chaperone [Phyllobacterium meliloti]|uniref:fimbrial biogenesis chaperone n=1 Tax=Phyllobacterium meliloti TaxID=555317 RepID=UPI001D14C3C1|nr:molecular chaperone [Phyllobacterium sp. T1293]UGX89030.1 molecular chaperone [Phyllobacterium sp. T1293]
MRSYLALLAVVFGLIFAQEGRAASLQVSPISVDLTAPARASSVNLRNTGTRPVNVQIRVFKWTQTEGKDQLVPALDVVASPPAASIQPDAAYTIRIARNGSAPPAGGEGAYRLLIDELPEVNLRRSNTGVGFVVQYSIPVFFGTRSASSELHWNISRDKGNLVLEATNKGNRHAKIANLKVTSSVGPLPFGNGLNGYVLPGSTMRWVAPVGARHISPGSSVNITASGDDYAVNESATVTGR